jgi:hypothetical protein
MTTVIPHQRIVVAFCVAAIVGYSIFSAWAVFYSDDAALRGDVIGTWKSFAVAAFTFWMGSSSGGKAKDAVPTTVQIDQPADRPVPVETQP